jgi:hypothetical protein
MPQLESLLLEPAIRPRTRRPFAEAELLSAKLMRAIRRETGDKVRGLKVRLRENCVVVLGRCGTYYCKQRVQQAVLGLIKSEPALRGDELDNRIEVW